MRELLRRLFVDGTEGNDRLTATTAVALLVLLAIEGGTILAIRSLLSVHVFVGMLLIPPVALKLAATGYRFARYYLGAEPYILKGPPARIARFLVAPVLVISTVVLFATGVASIVIGPHRGVVLGLHKASFVIWFGAMSVHVLTYVWRLPKLIWFELTSRLTSGSTARRALVLGSLVLGTALAVFTLPYAKPWFDRHEHGERKGAPAQRLSVTDVARTLSPAPRA